MSKFIGRKGTLLVAKESVRGTATTSGGFWVPRSTISFDDKVEIAREDEALGKIADSDNLFVTQKMASGEIESNLDDKLLGIFLTSLFGSSPSTSGGGPYTHAYTLNNSNQHQSLSVLYQDPDTARLYPLSVVDSFKIAVEQNALVMFTVGLMSRGGKQWTAQNADFSGLGNKFLHQHLVFKTADTVAGLAGANPISIKSLELTINANTIVDSVLGTVEPEDILNQQFSVEGSITLNKEDESYRELMLTGNKKAVSISFVRDSSSQFNLTLPRVDFTEWEQDRTLNSIVSQTINIKGNYDAANSLDIISTCELINSYTGTNY